MGERPVATCMHSTDGASEPELRATLRARWAERAILEQGGLSGCFRCMGERPRNNMHSTDGASEPEPPTAPRHMASMHACWGWGQSKGVCAWPAWLCLV